jgi:hypothetical protein
MMHGHPAHVVRILAGFTLNLMLPDGSQGIVVPSSGFQNVEKEVGYDTGSH